MNAQSFVDSVLKIGLGALITAFGALAVAWMTHRRELARESLRQNGELEKEKLRQFGDLESERLRQAGDLNKEKLTRLIVLLEDIASRLEDFHKCLFDYAYSVPVNGDPDAAGDAFLAKRIAVNQKLRAQQAEKVAEKQDIARSKNDQLISCRTRLRLLGAKKADQCLTKYKHAAEEFWLVSTNEPYLNVQHYTSLVGKISEQRAALDEALTELYPLKAGTQIAQAVSTSS